MCWNRLRLENAQLPGSKLPFNAVHAGTTPLPLSALVCEEAGELNLRQNTGGCMYKTVSRFMQRSTRSRFVIERNAERERSKQKHKDERFKPARSEKKFQAKKRTLTRKRGQRAASTKDSDNATYTARLQRQEQSYLEAVIRAQVTAKQIPRFPKKLPPALKNKILEKGSVQQWAQSHQDYDRLRAKKLSRFTRVLAVPASATSKSANPSVTRKGVGASDIQHKVHELRRSREEHAKALAQAEKKMLKQRSAIKDIEQEIARLESQILDKSPNLSKPGIRLSQASSNRDIQYTAFGRFLADSERRKHD